MVMNKLLGKVLDAQEIILADGRTFSNVKVSFIDDFVVVSTDDETEPVFYNKALVDEIRGVSAQEQRQPRLSYF